MSLFSFNSPVRLWVMGVLRMSAFVGIVLLYSPLYALLRMFVGDRNYVFSQFLYWSISHVLNMRIRVSGRMHKGDATLYMANHTSYLDVPVLGRYLPAYFVAKSDVGGWPIFGPLTRLYRTVFVERKATRAAAQRDAIRPLLEKGLSLVIFPEGTSTDGKKVLPFKSSLFALAEGKLPSGRYVTVQPVTVLCHDHTRNAREKAFQPFYAWYGDMDFLPHLWPAFQRGHFLVDVVFHPPVTIEEFGGDRKKLAAHCHANVLEKAQELF